MPKSGWKEPFQTAWPRQLLIGTIGLIIIAAVLGIAHLMRVRHLNLTTVRRLSRRMQLALDASKIGVWEMDVATGNAIWDARMYALYDKSPDCGQGALQIWSERLHPDDQQKEKTSLEITLAEEKDFQSTFRIVLEDGTIRYLQAFGAFYKDRRGRTHVIGVNRDTTEDVQLQEDLKRANIEAQRKTRHWRMRRRSCATTPFMMR
nr:PAS domain-containing protein [Marinicella sp. W31]MDC2878170.1 PAS domain-containing protein [Marinicella sp. W31]